MQRVLFFLAGFVAASAVFGLGWWLRDEGDGGTFITRPGTTDHGGTGWRVVVDEGTGRHTLTHGTSSLSPLWTMKPGWFVWLESDRRAWSFNGDDQLLLFIAGRGDDSGAFSADHAPGGVPATVVRRIGEERVRAIAATARASRERLGLVPAR